jgi:hypothetical protein
LGQGWTLKAFEGLAEEDEWIGIGWIGGGGLAEVLKGPGPSVLLDCF